MKDEICACVCVCAQLKAMREVMQGDASNPKVTMGNNYRPVMPIHQRTVRTNINFNNPVCLRQLQYLPLPDFDIFSTINVSATAWRSLLQILAAWPEVTFRLSAP